MAKLIENCLSAESDDRPGFVERLRLEHGARPYDIVNTLVVLLFLSRVFLRSFR